MNERKVSGFYLDPVQKQILDMLSVLNDTPMSTIVGDAINKFIETELTSDEITAIKEDTDLLAVMTVIQLRRGKELDKTVGGVFMRLHGKTLGELFNEAQEGRNTHI